MAGKLYSNFFKPLIDTILALMGFIILSPVFLIVAVLLLIFNRGKAFFLQPRPGKGGRIFRVIKFKTMNDRRGIDGQLLPDAQRITPFGSFVRKTSLDEIPQLLNVIKGDMSLVGPRPLLVEYLPLYTTEQSKRHNVRPGITGWAQVNGRNAISWDEKFKYDIWYVNNISPATDIKIIWMTFSKVFKSEGISQQGHVTMEKFGGTRS
ncbi:sugar transferase [Mucilaginibacter terrigena]|uniref:Sugar transferase n=1 Tax=Mucilaginibacter terrigena TaxID=2492395 RepID=A0A4Q5LKJ1_9SPHI|nr:sugar transferase [Mucilaginibacter terrigena]RYU90214.1 sugar transferase [Mucilaginibacter terrigena]